MTTINRWMLDMKLLQQLGKLRIADFLLWVVLYRMKISNQKINISEKTIERLLKKCEPVLKAHSISKEDAVYSFE